MPSQETGQSSRQEPLSVPMQNYFPKKLKQAVSSVKQNVGDNERIASTVGGSLLALLGVSRRGLLGLGMIAAGAALINRGVTGHCSLYGAMDVNTSR